MTQFSKTNTGRVGEDIARRYLENKGYKIVEQNYRTKYAEIDIIAKNKDILIFIEVRTKTGEFFGTPEETINRKKMEKLRKNAIAYAARKEWKGAYHIDAICIILKKDLLNKDYKIERLAHYENICS